MRLVTSTVVLITFLFYDLVYAFCPSQCICANDTRNVNCKDVKLDIIPSFLNPSLQTLNLAGTGVKLDRDYISLYRQLQTLDLGDNEIVEIPSGFFDDLVDLRELRLTRNSIRSLDIDVFSALPKLEHLDLSHNQISNIESEAFAGLEVLELLNLTGNNLQIVEPRWFDGLSHLLVLDLSNNSLRSVSSAAFTGLVALESLELGNNELDHIHAHMFTAQRQLKALDLQNNRVQTLGVGCLDGLTALVTLNLAGNPLRFVETSNWIFTSALENLDLTGNLFESLDGVLNGLQHLRSLRLDYSTSLVGIEENVFDGIHHLESLSASHCPRLRFVHPATFARALRLRRVDLAANAIETLDSKTFRWDLLQHLELTGNPWHCDCTLLSFLPEALQRINNRVAENVRCAQPLNLNEVDVAKAKSELCDNSANRQTLIYLGAAISLLVLLIALCICCLCCLSRRWNRKQKRKSHTNGRLPLYAAPSSSFSESLVYDKPDPRTTYVTCNPSTCSNYAGNQWFGYTLPSQHPVNQMECEYSSVLMPQCISSATSMSYDMSNEVSPYAMGHVDRLQRPPSFIAPPPPRFPPPPIVHRQR
ncbi:LRRCT domain-containing protein [Aphelenchoides besseyi]|nr:LRRCT domain-containing protein [Aphelenchoides besseyi]